MEKVKLFRRNIDVMQVMNLIITHKNSNGRISTIHKNISFLALLKHMAIAGQGHMPHIRRFPRVLGMFLRFSDYLNYRSLKQNKFHLPQNYAYDPTEIAAFSNVVGKAFADYLVKEIDSAKLTFNYEAAMRKQGMKITGKRPDLLCICQTGRKIAIEAKGRKEQTISGSDMQRYKNQAQSGLIPVNSVVASVAYSLYNRAAVKYYDPEMEYFDGDNRFVQDLIKEYYSGVRTYLNKNVFDINKEEIHRREYYILRLTNMPVGSRYFGNHCPIFCKIPLSILLNRNIEKFAQSGEFDYFMERVQEENIYIDTDGIGLMIGERR